MAGAKELTLIDGDNLLHQWFAAGLLQDDGNYQWNRECLVEIMVNCTAYWGVETVIVFDAHSVAGGQAHVEERTPLLKVAYTAEGETADTMIERLSYEETHLPDPPTVMVVTSDYAEQRQVFYAGGIRCSAREMTDRVLKAQAAIRRTIAKNGKEKRVGESIGERLSGPVLRGLEQLRRDRGETDGRLGDPNKKHRLHQ
jgi:predicted RNA-binding protein with PIN domain